MLLHGWLFIGGGSQWTLRLPSVLLFLTGLIVLASVARKLAGNSAFLAVICLGTLWPFSFHFGRLAGWYSWTFFLVALLTPTYLRYLEAPDWRRLVQFVGCALLLVYSNYYGWAVVGCLALDIVVFQRHHAAGRFLLATFGTLAIAYIPLWPILANRLIQSRRRSACTTCRWSLLA